MGDGLDKNVDSAMETLNSATKLAEKIRKESGFMWLYASSLILFVLFFVLLFVGLKHDCGN